MSYQKRWQKLTTQILAHGLDGVALVPGPNMAYISGIHAHLSERPIVLFCPADDEPAIIIPLLEAPKAHAAGLSATRIFTWTDDEGYNSAFQQACAQLELSDYLLGVEALHMRVLELELLQRYAPGLKISHAEPVLAELRMIKDLAELTAMQKAAVVAETAMKSLLPRIKVGQTEKQIATMLVQEMSAAGGEGESFPAIVSAGPNGASPHAVPTDRPIQKGDLLIIDWGALVDGYPSDITRTFAVKEVDAELQKIYAVVQQANEAGKAAAKPGATGRDIDRAARGVIEAAGYGEYFIHRTGHGLGVEVHEPPFMMEGNTEPMREGMVFTVEPGIYLPGRGGVRIEDDLVITSNGYRSLTRMHRELISVG